MASAKSNSLGLGKLAQNFLADLDQFHNTSI
jgi:hypothetical protein